MKPKHIKARIAQCLAIAECSNCPRNKFGCVIVDPVTNTVKSEGYNNPQRNFNGPYCGESVCSRDELNIISGTCYEIGCL